MLDTDRDYRSGQIVLIVRKSRQKYLITVNYCNDSAFGRVEPVVSTFEQNPLHNAVKAYYLGFFTQTWGSPSLVKHQDDFLDCWSQFEYEYITSLADRQDKTQTETGTAKASNRDTGSTTS